MFGQRTFTSSDFEFHAECLKRPLDPQSVSFKASGGGPVPYLEGWKSIQLANDIFGFNGWSSSIMNLTTDYVNDLRVD